MINDVEINESFENLRNVIEEGRFVRYYDEVYCVAKTCEGCIYADECEFEEEPLEVNPVIAIRNIYSTGNTMRENYLPLEESDPDNLEALNIQNFLNVTPDGYLSKPKRNLYKYFDDWHFEEDYTKLPFAVYDESTDKHICLRQVCSECEFYEGCRPEMVERDIDYRISVLDARAQEPRAFTRVAYYKGQLEKNWTKVFQNDSLRKDPLLLSVINKIAELELSINPNENTKWWTFIDKEYFYDRTELFKLNYHAFRYKVNRDPHDKEEVEKIAKGIIQRWKEFQENGK